MHEQLLDLKYDEERKKGLNLKDECLECGNIKTIQSRGLCAGCYQRNRRNGTLEDYPTHHVIRGLEGIDGREGSLDVTVQYIIKHHPEKLIENGWTLAR